MMAVANSLNNPAIITWNITRINRFLDPKTDANHLVSIRCDIGPRYDKVKWEFELLFNESCSIFADWISFSLRIVNENKTVSAQLKISIVNNNGVEVLMDDANDAILVFRNKEIYPIDRFIKKEDLFANFDEYAPNETLTIVIEINILSCVTNHAFLPKRETIESSEEIDELFDF